MPHPKIDNETALVVEPLLLLDELGQPALTIVAKASFALGPGAELELLEEQPPLDYGGEFWFPEAELSSYRREPEIAPLKLATDVAVIAHAHAPGGRASVVEVGVQVGGLVKQARVFGDRWWLPHAAGEHRLSQPRPFERLPLCYELAFGGTVIRADGRLELEPRNPLGRGLAGQLGPDAEQPAANIEDPHEPVTSLRQRPAPLGFGFTSPNQQPRAALAGTYDASWERARKPLLAADFDPSFYNAASPGLVAPGYLRGDEAVVALNLGPEGRLDFRLPGVAPPRVRVSLAGARDQSPAMNFDTLILDFDRRTVAMLWRARLPLPGGFHSLHAIEVDSELKRESEGAA